jgi:hypothetical protein
MEGLGPAGFPERLREAALVTTDEGLVTRPIALGQLSSRLGLRDRPTYAYPVLSDG